MKTIKHLLENSNLPGPRGNLELLYEFSREADNIISRKCLGYIKNDTLNSPEEFVGMCGIVGFAIANRKDLSNTIESIRKYASHGSWRIRESVAIALQEISMECFNAVIDEISKWDNQNPLEMRAVVAAVCEPKLLKNKEINLRILELLKRITESFIGKDKIDENEKVLRQCLGYGWSVLITNIQKEGMSAFEKMDEIENKHIQWIVRENLKKNRLTKMNKIWVDSFNIK